MSDPTVSYNDPKMLELLKEINQTKELLANAGEAEKPALKKRLTDLQMHYDVLSERRGPR